MEQDGSYRKALRVTALSSSMLYQKGTNFFLPIQTSYAKEIHEQRKLQGGKGHTDFDQLIIGEFPEKSIKKRRILWRKPEACIIFAN